MALKSLNKLRLSTKKSAGKPQPPQDPEDDTEATHLSQEDSAKYGHITYDDVHQEEDIAKYGYNTYYDAEQTEDVTKYGYNTNEDIKQEEDVSLYGYNTYDGEEQETKARPSTTGSEHRHSGHSQSHRSQRMPRRSSLKGSNPDSPRRARRHSLTFSNNVTVATITPTKRLAKKKSLLWLQAKDYDKMHQKIHDIVQRAKQGEGNKVCTRGLESIMGEDSEARRYAAWDAVMKEQEYQADIDHYDDGAVSNSYQEACQESTFEATLRGLRDQHAVKEYLSDTRKYCRRMSL